MGRRGPRPLPTAAKIKMGVRPSRLNLREPLPPEGDPRMPADLHPEARRVWRAVLAAAAPGQITGADAWVLRAFCESWLEYRRCAHLVEQTGPVIKGRQEAIVASPASREARAWLDVSLRAARALGLDPSSRTGIVGGSLADDLAGILGPSPRALILAGLPADAGVRGLLSDWQPQATTQPTPAAPAVATDQP